MALISVSLLATVVVEAGAAFKLDFLFLKSGGEEERTILYISTLSPNPTPAPSS
jgi:hypothetical protein